MLKSNIKEAALKSGFVVDYVNHDTLLYSGVEASLTKFAALVRAEREWVDLTDDEFEILWRNAISDFDFANAVIAAFKEKNK